MENGADEEIQAESAGGIVIGDGGMIVLVRHESSTQWLFPKGRIDSGETDEDAARREIAEEAGLTNLEFLDDLGIYERPALAPDGSEREHIKKIHMFLFSATPRAEVRGSMEIAEARWFPYRDLASHIGYEKDRIWYATVFERVRQAIQRD